MIFHFSLQAAIRRVNEDMRVFAACLVLCAFGASTTCAASPREVTLRLVRVDAAVKEGEAIGVTMTFAGGADETTLILPMGADPSGIITCRATEIASGREWAGAKRDPRSFAADTSRRLPAEGSIELQYALEFEGPDIPFQGNLPAGRYRIICTYDETRTFSPEHRSSRVLRSEPVEIAVTAR